MKVVFRFQKGKWKVRCDPALSKWTLASLGDFLFAIGTFIQRVRKQRDHINGNDDIFGGF